MIDISKRYPNLTKYLTDHIYKSSKIITEILTHNDEILVKYSDNTSDWTPFIELNGWMINGNIVLDMDDLDGTERQIKNLYQLNVLG